LFHHVHASSFLEVHLEEENERDFHLDDYLSGSKGRVINAGGATALGGEKALIQQSERQQHTSRLTHPNQFHLDEYMYMNQQPQPQPQPQQQQQQHASLVEETEGRRKKKKKKKHHSSKQS